MGDADTGTWYKVAAAIQLQFGKDDEEAYAVFDEWSQEHSGYDDVENRKRWDIGFSRKRGSVKTMRGLVFDMLDYESECEHKRLRRTNLERWGIHYKNEKPKEWDDADEVEGGEKTRQSLRLDDIWDMEYEAVRYYAPIFLPTEGLTLIVADPKAGKSIAMLIATVVALAEIPWLPELCAVEGREDEDECNEYFIKRLAEDEGILFYANEDSRGRVVSRIRKICKALGLNKQQTMKVRKRLCIRTIQERQLLGRNTNALKTIDEDIELEYLITGIRVVHTVVDTLETITEEDNRDHRSVYKQDSERLEALQRKAITSKRSMATTHHTNKQTLDISLATMFKVVSGSQAIAAKADHVIVLARTAEKDQIRVLTRGRDSPTIDIVLRAQGYNLEFVGEAKTVQVEKKDKPTQAAEWVMEQLKTEDFVYQRDVKEMWGLTNESQMRKFKEMLSEFNIKPVHANGGNSNMVKYEFDLLQ
jgi:RecA-family ATPase